MERIKALLYLYSILFYTPTPQSIEEARRLASILGETDVLEIIGNLGYEGLLKEYTRTFHGGVKAGKCPPYESFYREGLQFGETSVIVAKLMESEGFELSVEGELPDHIAVELEFASLTLNESILGRLGEWVPRLHECLKGSSPVYAKLAMKLVELLNIWASKSSL